MDPEDRPQRFRSAWLLLASGGGVVVVLLAIWHTWLRGSVSVRPARDDDIVQERYAGIGSPDAEIRNIAVVRGMFTDDMWLAFGLRVVEHGRVHVVNEVSAGRSPTPIGAPPWESMVLTLALGSWDTPAGRMTHIGCVGQSRCSTGTGARAATISRQYSYRFSGTIVRGRKYIIHVEGDAPITMPKAATLADFARVNTGNFLVVTAELH